MKRSWMLWLALPVVLVPAAFASLRALPRDRAVASFATTLEGRSNSQRHNARLSMAKLNGAVIAPHDTFSFNQRVGTFSRDAGYRRAPVSYNGQLINDWGGGVCQTSTTLYNAALLAGLDVVERHRHQFQPSYVSPGRDAAVAFSSIDLKLRNPYDFPVRVGATMDSGMLRVAVYADRDLKERPQVYSQILDSHDPVTYRVGHDQGRTRIRNSGKRGWEVAVFRVFGDRKELISKDNYPVMNRVVEFR